MNRYYIIGKHRNGKHGILCVMDGTDGDEALAKARRIYGCSYAYGFQPIGNAPEIRKEIGGDEA